MGNNVLFEIDEVQLIFGNSLFCSPWMNFKLVWFPIFPGCSTHEPFGNQFLDSRKRHGEIQRTCKIITNIFI